MIIIYNILFAIIFLYGLYFIITGLFAFKNLRKPIIGRHEPKHKFAVLIAARNEETVIEDLIKSLYGQNYPEELYEVFVIPNNCTDHTEQTARAAGATILNCTAPVCSKGDVLKYTFERLGNRADIDAFTIMDADNVVHPDFLARMNDALCEGYRVAQGFRDSKNYGDNWLSGSYSIFYWLQNFFFNKARMQLNGSASINGTGFMIKKDIFSEFGFNTVTMTEDIEFSAQCAINNIKIVFVEDAITYDEQPLKMKASWTQRRRWSTGTLQCYKNYHRSLIRSFLRNRNIACIDMLLNFMAPVMQLAALLPVVLLIPLSMGKLELVEIVSFIFALSAGGFFLTYLITILINILIVLYNKKNVRIALSGVLLFAFFMFTWIPINATCVVKKSKNWAPIQHNRKVDTESLFK